LFDQRWALVVQRNLCQESPCPGIVACGVAFGMVAAVVLAVKLMPTAVTLLAILGLGLVIQVWDRLSAVIAG
jgi:hypothetical protein